MMRTLQRAERVARSILRRVRSIVAPSRAVSADYQELNVDQAGSEAVRLRGAWHDTDLPKRQRSLVDEQLAAFRNGRRVQVFDVMVEALSSLPGKADGMSLLEIGCSSGYYGEVLDIAGIKVSYAGCDYSEAFIAMAHKTYPQFRFDIADATELSYPDCAFDIVVSGCCLLHIPEYERAITETARVARSYVIFHRTTVLIGQPEKVFRKRAYGVETIEIHFNEAKFLALLQNAGLVLIGTYTFSETVIDGAGEALRTYVCRKSVK